MSTATEAFNLIKKIFLISEEISRLTTEMDELSRMVDEHDRRLIRIETVLEMASKRSRLILPGE
ncbi:MAG TPA: hypothetical protein VLI45_04575 [Acidobacteriaceae bacterium]|nr:hypothetical protein [Acidobacteriaceae bacterium]